MDYKKLERANQLRTSIADTSSFIDEVFNAHTKLVTIKIFNGTVVPINKTLYQKEIEDFYKVIQKRAEELLEEMKREFEQL